MTGYDADEIKKRKDEWRKRMAAQYASYRYKTLRGLVSGYYEMQENRIAMENRFRVLKEVADFNPALVKKQEDYFKLLRKEETKRAKDIEDTIKDIPIYRDYLEGIHGLGPVLSGCLIAYLQDPKRFDTVSALHRYCGVSSIGGQPQKKHMGNHVDYNPKLKTLMFKIGTSFLKAKNEKYRKIYDEAHAKYEARGKWSESNPTGNKNKLHLMFRSLKSVERIFLQHLWVTWREMEELPVSEPYIFGPGGHDKSHYVKP
nr:transposase [Ferrimicrobium acidiphilum]